MPSNFAEKLILIGIDGASMDLVLKFAEEGKTPNIATLLERGVHTHAIAPLPTITPSNWTTIATGALPGSHSITDFWTHTPGQPLDKIGLGFDTTQSKAEYIWDAAERAGKRSIIIKYEASWPPTHKNGIQVEGLGPGGTSYFEISPSVLFTLEDWPLVNRIELQKATGWENLPESSVQPLESVLVIQPKSALTVMRMTGEAPEGHWEIRKDGTIARRIVSPGKEKRFHLLLVGDESGYNRALVCRSKNVADAIAGLKVGEWSDWTLETFEYEHDSRDGNVRFKLLKLAPDASEFELFMPQIFPTRGYIYPESMAEELNTQIGPFLQNPGRTALANRWIDQQTFLELVEYHHQWMADAATYLMSTQKWDLCFLETHVTDYLSHTFVSKIDPLTNPDEESRREFYEGYAQGYANIDRMVGKVLENTDEDKTLVIIVADHGGTANFGRHDVNQVLEEAGLLVYKPGDSPFRREIDWSKTKAVSQRAIHVYVNLKGRDPDGIVEKSEYEDVRDQIIDALHSYKDPQTGKGVFTIALRREDAKVLGQFGERSGDVIFAVRPEYGGEHGPKLSTSAFGISSMSPAFIMAGPSVKRGCYLERPTSLVNIAPTIAHLMRLPMPKQAEGAIIYEALEDPDAILKELRRVEEERDRWKDAYEGYRKLTHIG